MPRKKFSIIALLDPDPLGLGHYDRGKANGSIPAKHKWNSEERPYCIANEYICSTLGQFIGLPVPPFAITYTDTDQPSRFMFSSLNFNFNGRNLSPVIPENCLSSFPDICAGIIAFDVLIANADRHDENLAVDRMNQPQEISVFDHDCALFGANFGIEPHGTERLKAMNGRLGISAGSVTGGNRHCLLDSVASNDYFEDWAVRIHQITEGFIRRVCNHAQQYGITALESTEAAAFLIQRKWEIAGIMNRRKDEFPGILPWRTI